MDLLEISVPLMCIHVLSLVLNGALCGTLLKKPLFRCPSNRFVLSLTISHILVSLLTVGLSLAALIQLVSMNDLMAEIKLYMTYGSGLVNSLTLTAISCERYVTIARPMRYKSIVTAQRCSLVIIGLWAISTLITLFPFLLFDTSAADFVFVDSPFFAIVFICVTALCLVVMSVCYYIIFKIAKEKCQQVQIGQFTASISSDWPSSAYPSQAHNNVNGSSGSCGGHSMCEGQNSNPNRPSSLLQHVLKANARHINSVRAMQLERVRQRRPYNNSPRKTIATIIALVGNLILTQFPVSLTLINSKTVWWNFAMIMLAMSGITNPILYGFLNRKIRGHMWRTLRMRGKASRPDCCKYQQQQHSIYSDTIVRDPNNQHHNNTVIQLEEKAQTVDIEKDEPQPPDPILQFPRKDSQDSGADMTFSDEEEEPTKEPNNVFTISQEEQHEENDDDQPHQMPHD